MRENLVRHTRSCDAGSRRSVVNSTLAIGRLCRLALVLSVLGLGVFLGWGIWWWLAASQRGLDLSDESLYILMAERPRSYLQAPWQAHQLWGVVLDAVGTVQRLRIARIALLLSAHLVLARSFLSAFPSLGIPDMQRAGRSVVVAAVAAGAFLPAVWLPQTPGYNDMAVLLIVLLSSITFHLRVELRSPRRRNLLIVAGALSWFLFMSRFGSIFVLAPLSAVIYLGTTRTGIRVARDAATFAAGVALGMVTTHLLLAPVPSLLGGMFNTSNGFIGEGGHSATSLLGIYRQDVWDLVYHTLRESWLYLSLALLAGALCCRSRSTWIGPTIGAAAAVLFWRNLAWINGGAASKWELQRIPFSLLLFGMSIGLGAIAASKVARSAIRPSTGAALGLMLAPFFGALGTNNRLGIVAFFFGSLWIIAAVIAVAGSLEGHHGTVVVHLIAWLAVGLTVPLAVSGLWCNPYRQAPLREATTEVASTGILAGLRVDTEFAGLADFVRTTTDEFRREEPPTVVSLYFLPGMTLLAEGRTPVYAHLPESAPDWATSVLEAGCRNPAASIIIFSEVDPLPSTLEIVQREACAGRVWERKPGSRLPDGRTLSVWATP